MLFKCVYYVSICFYNFGLLFYSNLYLIQDAEFELVERTCCKSLRYVYGPTFSHFNFKAQPKNDKSASPKLFYAEVESSLRKGVIVKKCCIIELKNASTYAHLMVTFYSIHVFLCTNV